MDMPLSVSERKSERGEMMMFFIFIILALGLMMALTLEIGRIVYARGEVGKAADAAALAAAARMDVVAWRESGALVFLPDAAGYAYSYASMNSDYLAQRSISWEITDIWVDSGTQRVYATVTADLSALLPGFLPFDGTYSVTGFAKARLQ